MAAGQGGGTSAACFAARLLKHIAADRERGNLVFSPLSIHVAIALTSAGARGPTLDEILGVAGAPSRDALAALVRSVVMEGALADRSGIGGPSVAFSCGAWTDEAWALKAAYLDTVAGTYKGNLWTVDFRTNPVATRQHINNAWAAEATRNLITGILDPYKKSPHIVASAIYFKAEWHDPFDKDCTVVCNFHCLDGSSIRTPFMRSWRSDHRLACHDGFKVLKLPYKDTDLSFLAEYNNSLSKFSLCVFLPAARDGLPSLVRKIASYPDFLHDHLPRETGPVGVVRLPRFKLTLDTSIVSVLKDLGLHLLFHQVRADMTGMVEAAGPSMYVQDVFHKAAVEVNEEGSEAAAVTTESDSVMGFSLCEDYIPPPEKPANFVADHPFAFFIVEEISGAILFAGHVVDPSKTE